MPALKATLESGTSLESHKIEIKCSKTKKRSTTKAEVLLVANFLAAVQSKIYELTNKKRKKINSYLSDAIKKSNGYYIETEFEVDVIAEIVSAKPRKEDIDECKLGTHNCKQNEECFNYDGGYFCDQDSG